VSLVMIEMRIDYLLVYTTNALYIFTGADDGNIQATIKMQLHYLISVVITV
jgi:hypothetical protein